MRWEGRRNYCLSRDSFAAGEVAPPPAIAVTDAGLVTGLIISEDE